MPVADAVPAVGEPGPPVRGGGGERRDAQPRRPHRDERDVLDRFAAACGGVLERGDDPLVVRGPLRDAAGLRGDRQGGAVEREGVVVPEAPDRAGAQGGGRILRVQDEPVVPRPGGVDRVLREPVGAADALVPLADAQGVRERAPVHADGAAVVLPGADGGPLREAQGDPVPVRPGALDPGEGRARRSVHTLSVHRDLGGLAPGGYAQHQREAQRLRCLQGQGDRLGEGVAGLLGERDLGAVGHLRGHLAGGVHRGGETPVGRGEPQLLGEVRPAHAVVVRAAAVLVDAGQERLHGEAVLELALGLGHVVQVDAVGARDVVDRLARGVQRGGQRVERQLLAAVGPQRVAGDPGQQLVAGHELDDTAGLEALPGVAVPGARVLVPGEAPAGELAVLVHGPAVRPVRVPGALGRTAAQRVLGRLAEALRDVHVVRVDQVVAPVGTVRVDLVREVQQEGVTGPVEQPEHAVETVAPAQRDPAGVEGAGALGVHVAEEPAQEGDDPVVAGALLPGAQGLHQRQERPEVRAAVQRRAQRLRAEEPVGLLGGEDRVEPAAHRRQGCRVARDDRQVGVAAQPVRHLLPAAEVRADPAGGREVQEVRELLVAAAQPVELEFQLSGEPAPRGDPAGREPQEGGRVQGSGVGGVVAAVGRFHPVSGGRRGGRPAAGRRGGGDGGEGAGHELSAVQGHGGGLLLCRAWGSGSRKARQTRRAATAQRSGPAARTTKSAAAIRGGRGGTCSATLENGVPAV